MRCRSHVCMCVCQALAAETSSSAAVDVKLEGERECMIDADVVSNKFKDVNASGERCSDCCLPLLPPPLDSLSPSHIHTLLP